MTTVAKSTTAKPSRAARKSGGVIEMATGKTNGGKSRVTVYSFGSVSLKAPARSTDGAHNIGLGQAAMKKIQGQLARPGVKLRVSKATPLFRADPSNPRQLIRVLDGREERGVFENGVFKVRA
jgi:hypothetical protein